MITEEEIKEMAEIMYSEMLLNGTSVPRLFEKMAEWVIEKLHVSDETWEYPYEL